MRTTINKTITEKITWMVRRIAESFHPQKIILFGSYARGTATDDSDVDLLVVMEVKGTKRQLTTEIDLALADRELPLDLLVVRPDEICKYKDIVGHVLYPVLREGKVVYDSTA